MKLSSCVAEADLLQYLAGGLSDLQAGEIEMHLAECSPCLGRMHRLESKDSLHQALNQTPAAEATDTSGLLDRMQLLIDQAGNRSGIEVLHSPTSPGVAQADPSLSTVTNHLLGSQLEIPASRQPALGFLSPPQAPDEMGRLNGYRILKKLGEGGMGIVFEAEDLKLERRVALKVMKPEIAVKEENRTRFLREARTAAKVEHDHICPIHQVGEANGVPFIAMPFLKGEPLDERLKRQKQLPIAEAVRIGREVAEGLAAAHDAGLVHRDIKPGNVWLEYKDEGRRMKDETRKSKTPDSSFKRVRILDFGLARLATDEVHLTQSGAIMGTPAYMAPEQARGESIDHRADLFSLGVMLYEMTTGQRPFQGKDTMAILMSLAMDEPVAPNHVNPEVPAALSDLIVQLLSKSSADRPADGREVSEVLLAILMQTTRPIVGSIPQSAGTSADSRVNNSVTDPWDAIEDSAPESESRSKAEKPAGTRTKSVKRRTAPSTPSKKKPKKSGSNRIWIAAALGLLVLFGGGFAAYKLFFETKDGTLVVEVDGNADMRFKNGELQIHDEAGKLKYTLKPGERSKTLPRGKYVVAVAGVDGVKLDTDKFEIIKNGKVVIRVTAEPVKVVKREPTKVDVAKKDPPKVDMVKDPDRKAAEYVVSIGGTVRVDELHEDLNAAGLPRYPFSLTSVSLRKNRQVSDADLAVFQNCKNLTSLDLNETQVSDTGLAYFRQCKNLSSLSLDGTRVKDSGLAHFKDFKKLTALNLTNTQVGDEGLAHFKDRKALWDLSLAGTMVTDTGLAYFKDCKNLKNLYLSETRVTDAGLVYFQDCKDLEFLILRRTHLTAMGLSHLKNCKNLAEIDLNGTEMNDAGLAVFKECKNLHTLDVQNTQVTDTGLSYIKNCKNLKHVLAKKTKVTREGVAALHMALPNSRIDWDGGTIEPKK